MPQRFRARPPSRRLVDWAGALARLASFAALLGATAAIGSGAAFGATVAAMPVPPSVDHSMGDSQTLEVEPSDDYRSLDALLIGAKRSIDMTMYELADPIVQSELVAAHRRGVAVRVLLDRAFEGSAVNRLAAADLLGQGVPVRFAADSIIFHQKTVTVDGRTAVVMTGNLTSRYYRTTRDFILFDRDPAAVSDIEAVFRRDWSGSTPSAVPTTDGLVWSPGAGPALLALINGARASLIVESEEMDSAAVELALEAAARRGVKVSVVMTRDRSWAAALARLEAAGVTVALYSDDAQSLYIHAKVMVADGTTAYLGSQNFSSSSLDDNRELGVISTDPAVVAALASTLRSDLTGQSLP